jgi:hypothetical protein
MAPRQRFGSGQNPVKAGSEGGRGGELEHEEAAWDRFEVGEGSVGGGGLTSAINGDTLGRRRHAGTRLDLPSVAVLEWPVMGSTLVQSSG